MDAETPGPRPYLPSVVEFADDYPQLDDLTVRIFHHDDHAEVMSATFHQGEHGSNVALRLFMDGVVMQWATDSMGR